MNIYLISQDERDGFDTYDQCVVAAESEEAARWIHPSPVRWASLTWASSPTNVSVRLLGTAIEGTRAGVILSSFNAG